MKRIILTSAFIVLFATGYVSAQYVTGIGGRFGASTGLTVIQYFSPKSQGAANFILANKYHGIHFTGLFEIHKKNHNTSIELANVGFFAGIGGHVGSFRGIDYGLGNKKYVFAIGIDLTAGAEWKIPGAPLLLSVDIRPYYEWVKGATKPLDFLDFGASLRYIWR